MNRLSSLLVAALFALFALQVKAGSVSLPPSAVDYKGVSKLDLQAPAFVNTSPGTGRRTGGTQLVDFTYGSFSLPPNANATGKACALDTTKFAAKMSFTSATSSQFTGCVIDGTWDMHTATSFALEYGTDGQGLLSTQVYIIFSSDATLSTYANYSNTSTSIGLNVAKMPRGWAVFTMASLTPHGTTNWSAIKHIEIRFIRSTTAASDATNFYVYSLWNDVTHKTQVVLSHDDGLAVWKTYGYPIDKAAGIAETLYVNPCYVGSGAGYMTWAELKALYAEGFDIANHGCRHQPLANNPTAYSRTGTTATITWGVAHGLANGNTLTIAGCDEAEYNGLRTVGSVTDSYTVTFPTAGTNADTTGKGWCYWSGFTTAAFQRSEIGRASELLKFNGFYRSWNHWAYPNGTWDPDVMNVLGLMGMLTGRTIRADMDMFSPTFKPYNGDTTGLLRLAAYSMDQGGSTSHSAADVLAKVDAAIASNADIFLYGHGFSPDGGPASLCTAAATPYPGCTGAGTCTGCATSTQQWVNDYQTIITGLASRRAAGQIDLPTVSKWYSRL